MQEFGFQVTREEQIPEGMLFVVMALVSCSDGDETASDSVEVIVFETVVPGAMVLVQGGTIFMGDSFDEGSVEERLVHSIT